MRLLTYNIRYGTGGKRPLFPWSGYLRRTASNLEGMVQFIQSVDPDIIGLLEVDEGSYRSSRLNQAQTIADALGHYHMYRSKYHASSVARRLPLVGKQGKPS
jgi:endonuclease/exonuclease/phosphatase family metal-dependent hydrolase